MKAAISNRYGPPDVVTIRDMPRPTPQTSEVCVKVVATTVNRTDVGLLRGKPYFARLFTGVPKPKHQILGLDFAGNVESVGSDVTTFKVGDRVFGMSPSSYGAHAEYLCVSESGAIATIPADQTFQESVICEGAWYAHSILEKIKLKRGQTVMVYGASGAIGTATLQLAKSRGAIVTAVVGTRHMELVRSLGADHVIDYTVGDFTETSEVFDAVIDAVGKITFFRCRKLLTRDGTFAVTDFGPGAQNILLLLWSAIFRRNRVTLPLPQDSRRIPQLLKALIEENKFRAVIDRAYPLEKIADAYRYVETEQKTGVVTISVP